MRSALKYKWLFPAALAATLLCAPHAPAQEPAAVDDGYDGSRQIKFNGFSKSRPLAAKKKTPPPAPVYERVKRVNAGEWNPQAPKAAAAPQPAPQPAPKTPPKRQTAKKRSPHRPAAPSSHATKAQSEFVDIGVTVWKLKSGVLAEGESGIGFMTADGSQLVTPVRINSSDPVRLGDRLRFSIESVRAGYIYVINRTQYADDSVEEPELIFPTARTRGGDNRVTPGRLIYIPALDDHVPYFKVTAEGPDGKVNAGEIVSIIFSPKPIPELSTLTRDKVRISRAMMDKWTSTWGDIARQQELNLVGGEGRAATRAEHEAGQSDGSRALTQEEPVPQTLFRVRANPNGPAMVTLHLTYADSATSQK